VPFVSFVVHRLRALDRSSNGSTAITADQVKQLRDKTGAGMMECKAALNEATGNMEEAITILRKRGLAQAASAPAGEPQGLIGSYIHWAARSASLWR